MPIYEYICKKCKNDFELLVSSSTVPACPKCSSKQLEKRHSVFAAGVKNSGDKTPAMPSPCGTCKDPRGPGACAFN